VSGKRTVPSVGFPPLGRGTLGASDCLLDRPDRAAVDQQGHPKRGELHLGCAAFVGSADIADNAIVIRFKLTVNPTRPSYMQCEAVERVIVAFMETGLEFASATVAIQTVGGPTIDPALAAAAARASATKTG